MHKNGPFRMFRMLLYFFTRKSSNSSLEELNSEQLRNTPEVEKGK